MEPDSHGTVLIVDDEVFVREFVASCLRGHGYTVVAATDGMSALRVASDCRGRIDLLLTDVLMPGMDGCELAKRLAKTRSGMKVLFMSGYARLSLPEQARFLQKPFTARALLTEIEATLRGDAMTDPRRWAAGW